jgi:hypothetical protein
LPACTQGFSLFPYYAGPIDREHGCSPGVEQGAAIRIHDVRNDPSNPVSPAGERVSLTLQLDRFALTALEDEAREMNVSVEELGSFALLYYLADRDSGRIARRLPRHQADAAKRAAGGLHAR